MFGMGTNVVFFDRDKVKRVMNRKTARVLSRFGAFVRQRAKTSIKYVNGRSAPGEPPHAHRSQTRVSKKTGKKQAVSPLREGIFFGYDMARHSVVIGPAKLDTKDGDALAALEHGGRSTIGGKVRMVAARPFIGPAAEKEKENLPYLWRQSF